MLASTGATSWAESRNNPSVACYAEPVRAEKTWGAVDCVAMVVDVLFYGSTSPPCHYQERGRSHMDLGNVAADEHGRAVATPELHSQH